MKTKLRLLGSMMLLLIFAYGAQAIVLFQDNFSEYNNGVLDTNFSTWFWPPGDPGYTNQAITVSSGSVVLNYSLPTSATGTAQAWALFTNGIPGYSVNIAASPTLGQAITNWNGTAYYFPSNGPVAALYASMQVSVSSAFTYSGGDYFAMFLNTNFGLHPRVFVVTNSATPGYYRLAINNNSTTGFTNGVEVVSQDLTYGNTYDVVFKQVLSTGLSTLWVGSSWPASEVADVGNTNLSVSPPASASSVSLGGGITLADTTGTNIPSFTALCGFGFHNSYADGTGAITVNNLICGTTFADVVPASDGFNPPFISIQPATGTYITGAPATLSVVAGGDQDTITYQWYGPSGLIVGANSSTYTIASVISGASGYYVAITNTAGNITSSTATVTGLNSSAVPTISSGPNNTSTTFGSSATFSVTATDGGAPMTYQWYGPAGIIVNQTNSSLALSSVVYAQAGSYYVVVGNYNGPTTSTSATLTVNAPTIQTIAYIRSLLDNTNFNTNGTTALFTIKGTNNTWENQTTAGNSEFNLQDGTGGMNIFWSGAAASTNMPPAGAVMTITAPLAEFDGILEMEPVYGNVFHSVVTNSTNGILPAPMPLPFDPNMVGNPTNMQKHLMSCYFSASNVFLDLSTGPTFGDDDAEPLTNGQPYTYNLTFSYPSTATNQTTVVTTNFGVTNMIGETNTMFYNDHVINFIGATKPIGPCTIYGILSIHVTSTPYTSGYEFVATRLADVIPALVFTNVITNIVRYGDLATNTYVQNVLQPGETLTMNVIASDPGGGNVTLTGSPTGNGTWSAVNGSGTHTLTATYTYTGTVGEEGTTDTPTLPVSFSSSGFNSTYTWTIYVPTVAEQTMRITEVLPYASSDTNSPAYNPLGRSLPESNSVSYDQYVEVVNFGGSSVGINHWSIGNGSTALHEFTGGESLDSSNVAVVYGGPLEDPDAPAISAEYIEPASTGNGLTLTASAGVITLLDNSGNLVDRVAYPAAGYQVLDTNFNVTGQTQTNLAICSYSRFPGMNSPLVPQVFISTNYTTAGAQYDGTAWGSQAAVPAAVSPITTTASGGTVTLNFSASTSGVSTLWLGNSLLQPFSVLTGGTFTNTSGSFIISNTPPKNQYYFITTETPAPVRGPS